ncbi:MAG: glucose 1-dehydrogenase [Acidimicrobiia bacterium]|jgi:NAD(P)-dependent dehydrogenase (short-subunit alcohol dehydrogenase family)
MKLNQKVAIVTGSASGFGRATAARFAEEGASVVVADLDATGGAETVELVTRIGARAELVIADVSTVAGAAETVGRAVDRFGGLDVLVNNAGIAQGTERRTWDCEEELWDRVIQVNLKSVYSCTKAAVPQMEARGGGAIVSVASIAASVCVGGAAYAASKGGILSYTRHVARELAAQGIRANCVSPGFMRTPMSTGERAGLSHEEQDARIEGFARRVPMRRAGTVLDIADAIVYLASDESAYVTGQEIVVDGGYLVR